MIDLKKIENAIDDNIKSNNAKQYLEKLDAKLIIENARFDRFVKWLETNDFDKLMYRLILEHGDEYFEKCYHNGCEPYPNNKLEFVIDFISNRCELITIDGLDCDFPNEIRYFNGYYIQHVWGQGVIIRIHNKDDKRLLLQI